MQCKRNKKKLFISQCALGTQMKVIKVDCKWRNGYKKYKNGGGV